MAFYVVKYRQHPLDSEIDLDVDENEIYNSVLSSQWPSSSAYSFELSSDENSSGGNGGNGGGGSSDIPSLIDYYFRKLNTTATKVKVGTNLKAFTLYEFRVSAVNTLGASDETEPILVRTAATSKSYLAITFSL